jgi:hypothetical protein
MPVVFVEPANFFIEVLHELRAIVGKDRLQWVRKTSATMAKNSRAAGRQHVASWDDEFWQSNDKVNGNRLPPPPPPLRALVSSRAAMKSCD